MRTSPAEAAGAHHPGPRATSQCPAFFKGTVNEPKEYLFNLFLRHNTRGRMENGLLKLMVSGMDPFKIDVPPFHVRVHQLHADGVADIDAFKAVDQPSFNGWMEDAHHVPLSAAPVTIASNRSPILEASSMAAADFPTCRSTLLASSSFSVQCRASSPALRPYGTGAPAIAALTILWVTRSGKRRFGAVE